MKPSCLVVLLILQMHSVFAQKSTTGIAIQGIVLDSVGGKPLPFVTVGLLDISTSKTIHTLFSKEDGSFSITALPGKKYALVLAFVGYQGRTIPLAENSSTQNLGSLTLSPADQHLQVVAVTAVKPLIKRTADGINYDVQADPETPALTALDIVRKVPLLTVDASDNIKLKGSGNYKILINGKESALMAKNPSDVLRAMPATNIEKIEVITTPPAKYDAEGLAGIINITLKKNTDQGYTIGLNTRYNSVWGPGINMNGTLKQGKFGLSAFVGTNRRPKNDFGQGGSQKFFADNSLLSQDGSSVGHGHNTYGNAELSFEADTLDLITSNVEFFSGHFFYDSKQFSVTTDAANAVNQQYLLSNYGDGNNTGLDASINYQRGFKRDKNQLLTLSYKYSYSPNKQFNDNRFAEMINYDAPDYQQYNDAGSKEHTVQLDYSHPVKKWTIEAGAKSIFRNNYSDFESSVYDSTAGKYITSAEQSDQFTYHQNVYSIYNSYQLKLDKWNFKGGVRLERTTIDGNFITSQLTITQNYNNVVPSLSIQHSIQKSSFSFGYTDRIQRPGIYQLNPFVDMSNPKFISTGNPDLHPTLLHNFELTYNHFSKSSITAGISYSFSNNTIQTVNNLKIDTQANQQKDTITITTFQNLGTTRIFGFNFNTNFTITPAFTISVNGQLNHVGLGGSYNGVFYHNNGITGDAEGNLSYKFKKGFRFSLDAGYFSGDVTLQGKTNAFIYSSYVISKTFSDKKATISLVANNPYSRVFTGRNYFNTSDFYQTSYNEFPYRTFAIRFNFKFGKLNSDIKKNQRGIQNDDTNSGGKSNSGNQ